MTKIRFLDPAAWFSVGVRRKPSGWLDRVITPLAVALAVYVIVAATVLIIQPWALVAIFLMGIMTIAFLSVGAFPDSDPKHPHPVDYTLRRLASSPACISSSRRRKSSTGSRC